jgi:hypothetical protein
MLFGDDMVEMKGPERKVFLAEMAVFATAVGAVANQLAETGRHQAGCSER